MIFQNLIALVNENDEITGYKEKLEVHQRGLLHRAFSVFIFNSENKILLQRRALQKYHSGGLWTNTCCGHLSKGYIFKESVHNRLFEEMGFKCELEQIFNFHYCAVLNNGLIENEIDHVFMGHSDNEPLPDPSEVCEWKWADIQEIRNDLLGDNKKYTYWFNMAFQKILNFYKIPLFT